MIAYNKTWLYNNYVREQAHEALHEQSITSEEYDAVCAAKPVGFYSPNFFVRVGIALITVVIVFCASGLLGIFMGSQLHTFAVLSFIMAGLCVAVTETLIHGKRHYNSGADNMLIWCAAVLAAIFFLIEIDTNINSWLLMTLVVMVLAIRYADKLLSAAALVTLAVAILSFSFDAKSKTLRMLIPFISMAVFALLYVIARAALKSNSLVIYHPCFRWVRIVALLLVYASGNYYVVKETSKSFGDMLFGRETTLKLGWFFWIWTFTVPVIYLAIGIIKKDIALIRMGIPFIAVSILTFRYYHSIMPPEIATMLGGAILLIVSYSLIRALKRPRQGYTFAPETYVRETPDIGQLITNEMVDRSSQTGGAPVQNSNNW